MSVYVHIPYCASMCWYCACSVVITQDADKAVRYVDDVLLEADLVRDAMASGMTRGRAVDRPVVQHHWGGGTPTFLPPEECERLFLGLAERFPLAESAEVSIEVDPRVTQTAHLEALRRVGFHRISMGVQDFDPEVQESIHRVQGFEMTRELILTARDLGFSSVNLDLVYGLPHQTEAGFGRSLELVADLDPDRVACYSYAHVPWLKKHQKLISVDALPDAVLKHRLYLLAHRFFLDQGMEAIGMDHFAKGTDELAVAARGQRLHRNFMGYTTRPAPAMLGLGVTAIGEVSGGVLQNAKTIPEWQDAIRSGVLPVARGHRLTGEDEVRRSIILQLMCQFGASFEALGGRDAFFSRFKAASEALRPMERDGLVVIGEDGLEVTPLGRLLVRNLCMVFDEYLEKQRSQLSGPRFSRTV